MEENNLNNLDKISGALRIGDRIELYNGAEQIDAEGAYIDIDDDILIWSDSTGNVRFQFLGAPIGIRKV